MTLDPSAPKPVDDTDNNAANNRRDQAASGNRPADDGSMDARRPAAQTPEAMAASPRMCGYIDVIGGRRITGWAFRPDRPEQPMQVEIRRDDQVLATTRADRYRADLHRLGIGTGRHGFEVSLDKAIPSEERDRITAHARPDDTAKWVALPNDTLARTPQPATATEAPVGWHEVLESVRRDLVAQVQSARLEVRRLSDIQRTIKHPVFPDEASIATKVAAELRPAFDEVKQLAAAQATATEMLQTRADALLASLNSSNDAQLHGTRHDRTLYMIVIALGALSLVSLAVGIFSVLA